MTGMPSRAPHRGAVLQAAPSLGRLHVCFQVLCTAATAAQHPATASFLMSHAHHDLYAVLMLAAQASWPGPLTTQAARLAPHPTPNVSIKLLPCCCIPAANACVSSKVETAAAAAALAA